MDGFRRCEMRRCVLVEMGSSMFCGFFFNCCSARRYFSEVCTGFFCKIWVFDPELIGGDVKGVTEAFAEEIRLGG